MKSISETRVALWSEAPEELDSVQDLLSRLGFEVITLNSAGEVLRLVKAGAIDLVITWLCTGYHGPLELLDRMRGVSLAPPVLVVSCGLDVSLYLEAMRRGAFDCLGTPPDENELVRIVSEALEAPQVRLSA